MSSMESTDDLEGARLVEVSLRGARLTDCDLSGVVMRSVEIGGLDIDAPWLFEEHTSVRVNGVDVVPLVRAELERRFPGRELMHADDPEGLLAAWSAVEAAWTSVLTRVETMPEDATDVSVDGEWSLKQTLRHLVMATDLWLSKAILGVEQPFHPLGLAHEGADGLEPSSLATHEPTFAEVLEARADRVGRVRDFIASVMPEELLAERHSPWDQTRPKTTLSCLHTILHEEWEHLRFAVRDLDVVDATP